MSANWQAWPDATDDRLASERWAGRMARWAAGSATVASFAFDGEGSRRRIYVPLAATGAAGALSGADYDLLHGGLGDVEEDIPTGDTAIAATTVTQIAGNITLGAGEWLLVGWACILMGGSAGTAEVVLRQGTTRLTGATFVSLAANARDARPTETIRVSPTTSTTYNLAAFCSQAASARNEASAFTSLSTGIRAVRIG